MVKFWQRLKPIERVVTLLYALDILGLIAILIWPVIPVWPVLLLLIGASVLNVVSSNPPARNAQENDPNRR